MLTEIQAGMPRREAMRGLARRTRCPGAERVHHGHGAGRRLRRERRDVLRVQSHEMRLKRRQHAEETAQKAPAKMVFPLILCILPATLIVLMTRR